MSGRTRIKFCGMTSPGDVSLAVEAGADAVGIIVAPSARRVAARDVGAILAAIPPFVTAVVVTAGPVELDLAALAARGVVLQFSGDESAQSCEELAGGRTYIRAFGIAPDAADDELATVVAHVAGHPRAFPLFDTRVPGAYGGTGRTFSWDAVTSIARERPTLVSGGLTPENVAGCVRAVRPFAVDVRSGIESHGAKDLAKMRAFVRAVRDADDAVLAGR